MKSVFILSALLISVQAPQTAFADDRAAAQIAAQHGFGPEISGEDFSAHVKVLASDDFAGRAPGGVAEEKTVAYLIAQFKRLGLQPGNGDSWVQTVPMIESVVDAATTASITQKEKTQPLSFGGDMVLGTRSEQSHVNLEHSAMVFVGYGVNAPEQDWNDYAGIDVKGKTVVILVNDPGFHAGDASLFSGKKMTYYGRWTYKFEEAARQGAAAALIIHDDAGAAYGWDVVRNGWSGAQFDLPLRVDPEARLAVQGWLSAERAQSVFADAGVDLPALRAAANKRGFKAVSLRDSSFSTSLKSQISEKSSRNVLAKLPGSERPDEAIVYSAHWDHLGTHTDETGDRIYNGAQDNASGVAGVLEIAEAFTVQSTPPKRSVIFLMVTLEESGLLGSKYYAAHPVIPLKDTVAVINLDDLPVLGPSKDLVVIGLGNSELDEVLRPIAAAQGRVLVEEADTEKGYFFRSDHFNFAKFGVPAMYAKGGIDHLEKGAAYGHDEMTEFTAQRYHKPSDEYDANWDLRGIVLDMHALYDLGAELAQSEAWPNYYSGNAFKAARDAARAGK